MSVGSQKNEVSLISRKTKDIVFFNQMEPNQKNKKVCTERPKNQNNQNNKETVEMQLLNQEFRSSDTNHPNPPKKLNTPKTKKPQ